MNVNKYSEISSINYNTGGKTLQIFSLILSASNTWTSNSITCNFPRVLARNAVDRNDVLVYADKKDLFHFVSCISYWVD